MEEKQLVINQSLATASIVCGLMGILMIYTVVFPFVFGGVGIILACLSTNQSVFADKRTKFGFIISLVSLLLIILIVIYSFMQLRDPVIYSAINDTFIQIYGTGIEDFYSQLFNGSGYIA